ncbi:unnamed protein product, partial [Rotaria sordida]
FIKGLKYIPPCQSRFLRQSIDNIVNEQYKTLRSIVQGCLEDHRVQLIKPSAIHAPATEISKFLNDLLAPIFLRVSRQTTFINGSDLVRALEKYVANGYLKPTTLFITFDVENLYTMIPRQGVLEVLLQFLERNLRNNKIGTLRIDDIMRMARLVLDTNIFAYENKYYRQIRGGAMGSAFIQTLANIYMLDWKQQLMHDQQADQEIYGRFVQNV